MENENINGITHGINPENTATENHAAPMSDTDTNTDPLKDIISARVEAEMKRITEGMEAQKKELETERFNIYAKAELIQNDLPPQLLDYIKADTPEGLTNAITGLKSVIELRTTKELMKRAAGKTPVMGAAVNIDSRTAAIRRAWGFND